MTDTDDLSRRWAPTLHLPAPWERGIVTSSQPQTEEARAFVTEVDGRVLVTAPATAIAHAAGLNEASSMRNPTVDEIADEHLLWMEGKFVGADVPNRNGALWSSGDLETAKDTVMFGPLNWLHESRHIIGSLTSAKYVHPGREQSDETGEGSPAPSDPPHIRVTSAVWKWIYPDEAWVINQASEQKALWYSMECISKEVACAGPDGCGNKTTYAQYMAGAACEHVRERAAVRQFVNPIFLGGAVIVPPTRPGWAEADATVLAKAATLAEAAFEQAGEPDVSTNDWELLMAQVVRFAQT